MEILSSLSSTDGCPEVDESYHFICPVLGPRKLDPRGPPLSQDQWENATDDEGRIINPEQIKEIIFKGVSFYVPQCTEIIKLRSKHVPLNEPLFNSLFVPGIFIILSSKTSF